jgi:putative DNA primase/helicase
MITNYKNDYFKDAHISLKSQGYRNYIERLLPGGKWEDSEYVVKNPTRNDGEASSFKINKNGKWADFATNEAGNDLIGLTAYVKGISKVEACFYIGVPRPEKSNTKTTPQTDIKPATEPQLIVKQEHTLIDDEAMLELEQEAIEGDGREPAKKKGQVAIEPPAITARDTKYFNEREFKSEPTNFFQYQNSVGVTVGYIARWDFEEQGEWKKAVRPYIYNFDKKKWESKFFGSTPPKSRPLYNLPEILKREDAPVMIVEGEKTAEAAKLLFPDYVITTSSGGASQAGNTEWHWLNGREIILAPDGGIAGADYAEQVIKLLKKTNVTHIKTLEPSKLGNFTVKNGEYVKRDNAQPKVYDLANSLAEGWTHELIQQAQQDEIFTPFFKDTNRKEIIKDELRPQDELYELGGKDYKLTPNGLYKKILVQVKEESEQTQNAGYASGDISLGNVLQEKWQPLCGYLKPTHKIRDTDNSRGMLIKFKDLEHREQEVFLKRTDWLGEKGAVEVLQDQGLQLNGLKQKDIDPINEYLNNYKPDLEAVGVDKVGWQGDNETYILPIVGEVRNSYQVTKEDKPTEYILQQKGSISRELHQKGTLKEWQRTVGAVTRGNHLHTFSMLAALTAPILKLLNEEGGFFHYVGSTSIGKSTIMRVALSVWGDKEMGTFKATDNNLEGICKISNDGAMFLDEMGECEADALSRIVYMVANGVTKGRADRNGNPRPVTHFTVLAQSTGEMGIEAKLAEKRIEAKGGQLLRMGELDADRGKGLNTFDILNINPDSGKKFEDGKAQAEYLKIHAKENCGLVIDEFMQELVKDIEAYTRALKNFKAQWIASLNITSNQAEIDRMIKRFSTIYATGIVASNMRIIPHTSTEIKACIDAMFQNWLERRGGDTPHEFKTMIDNLYKLCKRNQYLRFKNAKPKEDERIDNPKDIAGYWKDTNEGKEDAKTEFWIFPKVFDTEILQGRDKNSFLPLLVKNGYLLKKDQARYTRTERVTDSNPQRFYIISADALNGEEKMDKEVMEEVEKYGVFPPEKI